MFCKKHSAIVEILPCYSDIRQVNLLFNKIKARAWNNKYLMINTGGEINGSRCNYDGIDKRTGR